MRRLLLSAALAFLAAPALAQPDNHRDDHPHERPQNQGQAQPPGAPPARPGVPPAQQPRGGNGGPTNFTNQITGRPPGGQGPSPNPQRDHGDRRGPQPAAQPQPTPAPATAAPANRGNRNDQGNRGNWQGQQGGNNNFNNNRGSNDRGHNGANRDYRNYSNFHRSLRADRRFRAPAYRRPVGWYQHQWNFGEFLPAAFWARDYWLMNFGAYDLPPPPYGAVWVRVGSDALLVDQDSGEIITVEYDVFY